MITPYLDQHLSILEGVVDLAIQQHIAEKLAVARQSGLLAEGIREWDG